VKQNITHALSEMFHPHTFQKDLRALFGLQAHISLFDLGGNLWFYFIFLNMSRGINGSRKEYMDRDRIEQPLRTKCFRQSLCKCKSTPRNENIKLPRRACFPGEYEEYPMIDIYPNSDETNTIFPWTRSLTIFFTAAYIIAMV
jgi:hypothetical protein